MLEMVVSKFHEVMCKHPTLTEREMDNTNFKETKSYLAKHGNIAELNTRAELFSIVCKEDSTVGC